MATTPSRPRLLKFGVFEVDLTTGEVRKAGMRQKLTGQPFQVLQALLERPQEIVTREELRERLWPGNTFVDYELALKKAVNRLREVLGDSAESPRFIETVPRRGYRFIGTVESMEERPDTTPAVTVPQPRTRIPWAVIGGLVLTVILALLLAFNAGRLRTSIFAGSRFSRRSAMHFKGTRETLPQIGQELKVDAVVEGSAVRVGDRVRITAQLVDTQSDSHLWAKSYERNVQDVLTLQDEVARDIAEEIRIKLEPGERTRLNQGHTINPEVLEACLKGRFYYEKLSVPGFKEAVNYYQRALAQDPAYAPAYVGLAASYKELGVWGALPAKEAASQATDSVEKALARDNTLGDAHAVLGHIHFLWDWDWTGAEREYKRALELGHTSTDTRIQYAVYLSAMGRHDDAVAEMREAHAFDPVSHPTNGLLGVVYYWARRFDEAIDQFQKTVALYPDSAVDHRYLGRCYELTQTYQEAMEQYLKENTLDGASKEELTIFRQAFLKSGMNGFLREELKSAIAPSNGHYLDAYSVAELYARLGERDQALQWLDKGYQERSHNMAFIKIEPMLDSLHSDPRFQNLLRRMRLTQ